MPKILFINVDCNTGSTGRIVEEIGQKAVASGYESNIGYGRIARNSQSHLIPIGNHWDHLLHLIQSRLLDNHGFASTRSTKQFVKAIDRIQPDIINMHNLHGYYLNVEVLFKYLQYKNIPIIWTLHDCWPFTGHCSHFERVNCYKWKRQCYECPNKSGYPKSWCIDNSKKNFVKKSRIMTGLKNLQIISPSKWLADHLSDSFLHEYPTYIINNGIDLKVFSPRDDSLIRNKFNLRESKIILGVANTWKKRKALTDFIMLSRIIRSDERIVLIGLNRRQHLDLPSNIITIARTENTNELAEWYSAASVFINPTYADNLPTTNIEALACGTPVITYKTGGSHETISKETGIVVEKGDIKGLHEGIKTIIDKGKSHYSSICRQRAVEFFNKDDRFSDYLDIINKLIKHQA